MRLCIKCNILKETSEFYTDFRNLSWNNNVCKKCNYIRSRDWAIRNRLHSNKLIKERTWRKWGIDVDEANKFLTSIKSCQICNKEENLVIDHCHITNKIRGVLCRGCNVGIGALKDSQILCLKAAEYLK